MQVIDLVSSLIVLNIGELGGTTKQVGETKNYSDRNKINHNMVI